MGNKQKNRQKRHKRIRGKIKGTTEIPRLCIFRSNKNISAQIIDDEKRITLISINGKKNKDNDKKIEVAEKAGELLAKKAIDNKIEKVVFDRAGYKYHGRIKAFAEGARRGGLKF